ncbi:MAG: grasp-with-spasm system SPASM domain peptide maturase [Chitinophaga sp.]|uniref:grasp-with-spasm system SPASM domain peptide maturase n=1 Tax=Chitinophaga sp. TaxID=1869181 RepID=UPI001B05F03B|nr:grasp-with-spasm system SPASM domain peptide maturase [Chitinophaga sp.]MBO9729716.1 grasp-with-spasm system SPASM domain peptide maturase [Chitinophaga sp.]
MAFLNLYTNCQLVRGANMSLLCDLQLLKFYHIPNDTMEVLQYLQQHSIEDGIMHFGEDNKEAIEGYIHFVVKKDMGFIDDHLLQQLIPVDFHWDSPTPVTNVILEYNEQLNYRNQFMADLFDLNVQSLEIRSYQPVSIDHLLPLLEMFNDTTLGVIKLMLPYDSSISLNALDAVVRKYPRLKAIWFHGAPVQKVERIFEESVTVVFLAKQVDSCLACGEINTMYFQSNIELFSESQHHNTCLNRKLSIDQNGYIRNCPSLPQHFGHMNEVVLSAVLQDPAFRKYWNIRKDDINTCRDCEFRHVCTDCRAYLETPEDIYSKPLKCGYNPYTNEWDEWTNNPLKQAAIDHYGLRSLVK